ncbi:hypothetical protein [Polyangium spumosum]|uniref:Uncharacterized protein n=1 Tax=Polyangium spumosum TaxID=889282 RepID=A0A6N7PY23_9BACT|nr:hypothetical protein [Polyangium spumosum]MRG96799.1 hypothetical protein [Polyangium spumosum]
MSTRVRPRRTLRLSLGASAALWGGTFTLLGASLFACGTDTTGVFQTGGSAGAGNTPSAGPGGSGGAGGQGGGQGGSGAGMTGGEDCLDGADNDGDGDADCADADCTEGFSCVEAPEGWSLAWTTEGDAPPAGCGDATPEELHTDPAGAAACTACTCGDLQGAACSTPGLTCHPNSTGCFGGGDDWSGPFQNATCAKPTDLLNFAFTLSCRLSGEATLTAPGSCAPSVSDFPNQEPFGGHVLACDVKSSSGGCGAGAKCAPKPAAAESLCLRQEGEQACPDGFTQIVSYKSAADTRGCSACACESAATCAGGAYRFYDADSCMLGGNANPIDINNDTCRNVSTLLDASSWSIEAIPAMPSGSCTPTGGAPTGELTPEGAVTFCCK